MLNTFVFVYKDEIISPILTTIREYGTWFEEIFDEYTAQMQLYMKSKKKSGESVLEWHPGTKIGLFYDTTKLADPKGILKCWYLMQDSPMMDKLCKHKMAEYKDAIPFAVNDEEKRKMLRLYTVEQVQMYIRSTIDAKFDISPYIGKSLQVKVKDADLEKLVRPKVKSNRKSLF